MIYVKNLIGLPYLDNRPLAKVSFYLIFELAKTLLNVALGCLNFDQRKRSNIVQNQPIYSPKMAL